MRKVFALVCAFALLAACRSPDDQSSARRSPSPSPITSAGSAAPGASGAPSARRPGQPQPGSYVYSFKGVVTFPDEPNATARGTREGVERTHEVTTDGNVVTQVETSSATTSKYTTRSRWNSNRVVQLSFDNETNGQVTKCTLDPPLQLFPLPLRATKLPEQVLDGEGAGCQGTRTIEIEGPQRTEDANGKSWSTWRIVIDTDSGGTGTTESWWFAPELGKEVRIQGITQVPGGNGVRRQRAEASSLLLRYPGRS